MKKGWWLIGTVLSVCLLFLFVKNSQTPKKNSQAPTTARPIPVEAVAVATEDIELRRTFSGTLESPAQYTVAAKVAGRVRRVALEIADEVETGQLLVALDDEEYVQALRQSEAEAQVARADEAEARSKLEVARREMQRTEALFRQGIATDARLDDARAELLTAEAALQGAVARSSRAEAVLEGARIRLGYTQVKAEWSGPQLRQVARRFVNEGDTVAPGTPLLSMVTMNPLKAILFVTERDYGLLQKGQSANLRTDAHAGRDFPATVARVAPVFDRDSRQARVELEVPNGDGRLKPGMFVQVNLLLARQPDARVVPLSALAERQGVPGVFILNAAGDRVRWQSVTVGIRAEEKVEITAPELEGRVVYLGHQMIQDGSLVTVPEAGPETAP